MFQLPIEKDSLAKLKEGFSWGGALLVMVIFLTGCLYSKVPEKKLLAIVYMLQKKTGE